LDKLPVGEIKGMLTLAKGREEMADLKERRQSDRLSELLSEQTKLLAKLSSAQKERKEHGSNREKLQDVLNRLAILPENEDVAEDVDEGDKGNEDRVGNEEEDGY
jgi:hypothetical protein